MGSAQREPANAPEPLHVGGWVLPIFFFGFIGGLAGWMSLKNSDRRRADHVLKWGLISTAISTGAWVGLILLVVGVAARSANDQLSSGLFTAAEPSTPSATTSIAAGAPPLGAPRSSQTIAGRSTSAFSARALVHVYRLRHADRLPALPDTLRSSIAACTVDSQTDAVIPIAVELTNTTSSFASVLSLSMAVDAYSYPNAVTSTEGDLQFSDGSSACDGVAGGTGSQIFSEIWNTPTPVGGHDSADFFLILHNYFTPDHPDGDASLAGLSLALTFYFGPDGPNQSRADGTPESVVL